MKKFLIFILVVAVIGLAAYAYVTRPVSAPTQDIDEVSDQLPAGEALYRISSEKSSVQFYINEVLRGEPTLVVGTTTQIAGDIAIEGNSIEVGTIKINARTFVTDNASRNGAINRLILKSEDPANEFITFVPTSNTFSGDMGAGKPFIVTGDITIAGVTKPAIFKVEFSQTGDTLTGTAETVIKRSDFDLVIPNLSFIANVDQEVPVRATIVAERVVAQ